MHYRHANETDHDPGAGNAVLKIARSRCAERDLEASRAVAATHLLPRRLRRVAGPILVARGFCSGSAYSRSSSPRVECSGGDDAEVRVAADDAVADAVHLHTQKLWVGATPGAAPFRRPPSPGGAPTGTRVLHRIPKQPRSDSPRWLLLARKRQASRPWFPRVGGQPACGARSSSWKPQPSLGWRLTTPRFRLAGIVGRRRVR